ncbi:MAG: hypothetical protein AB1611_12710 [bacterium]
MKRQERSHCGLWFSLPRKEDVHAAGMRKAHSRLFFHSRTPKGTQDHEHRQAQGPSSLRFPE